MKYIVKAGNSVTVELTCCLLSQDAGGWSAAQLLIRSFDLLGSHSIEWRIIHWYWYQIFMLISWPEVNSEPLNPKPSKTPKLNRLNPNKNTKKALDSFCHWSHPGSDQGALAAPPEVRDLGDSGDIQTHPDGCITSCYDLNICISYTRTYIIIGYIYIYNLHIISIIYTMYHIYIYNVLWIMHHILDCIYQISYIM